MTDGHWVTGQNLVVTHTPKPLVLQTHTDREIRNAAHVRKLYDLVFENKRVSCTLNTNFSPLRMAMVSKCPSQMSGPMSGVYDLVGRGGGGGGGGPPDLVPVGEMLRELRASLFSHTYQRYVDSCQPFWS